jgi:uncharacterized protein YdhG (YjbR/CyaY superfamily)
MVGEDTKKKIFKNVDEYIDAYPENIGERLKKIRAIVKKEAPEAEEVISYNMPAYKFHGMLLYFAVHTSHIGLYAMPSAIIAFRKELKDYETSKGGIKFPFDKQISYDLIRKIVKYKVKENLERMRRKNGKGN